MASKIFIFAPTLLPASRDRISADNDEQQRRSLPWVTSGPSPWRAPVDRIEQVPGELVEDIAEHSPPTELQWLAASASGLADVEENPLGERKLAAEIDGTSGAAHIVLPGVRTGFTAAARLFLATKGPANLGA